MSEKFRKSVVNKKDRGFVAVTSVLIISALIIILGVSMFHAALTIQSISSSLDSKQEASFLADFCVKQGVFNLKEDINYAGAEDVEINDMSCYISIVEEIDDNTKKVSSLARTGERAHFSRSSQLIRYVIESTAADWQSGEISYLEVVGDSLQFSSSAGAEIERKTGSLEGEEAWLDGNYYVAENVKVDEDDFLALFLSSGGSENWLAGWDYRREINIAEHSGENLTDYQILITLNTGELIPDKMKNDCGDIRFTDSDEITLIPYWIESGCGTDSTRIWVRVPFIPASSNKTIYIYYGNPDTANQSSGINTFLWFDDFDGQTVGNIPTNWGVWTGNFTISDTYAYSGNRSARLYDNSTTNSYGGIKGFGTTLASGRIIFMARGTGDSVNPYLGSDTGSTWGSSLTSRNVPITASWSLYDFKWKDGTSWLDGGGSTSSGDFSGTPGQFMFYSNIAGVKTHYYDVVARANYTHPEPSISMSGEIEHEVPSSELTGYRISNPLCFLEEGAVIKSVKMEWDETVEEGITTTTIKFGFSESEESLPDTWSVVMASGIPDEVSPGEGQICFWSRQELETTDPEKTPRLHWLVETITLEGDAEGYRISPELDISGSGIVKSSQIFWQADERSDGIISVEVSVLPDEGGDWGEWQLVTNGGNIPGLTELFNGTKIKTKITFVSTSNFSPTLDNVKIFIELEE